MMTDLLPITKVKQGSPKTSDLSHYPILHPRSTLYFLIHPSLLRLPYSPVHSMHSLGKSIIIKHESTGISISRQFTPFSLLGKNTRKSFIYRPIKNSKWFNLLHPASFSVLPQKKPADIPTPSLLYSDQKWFWPVCGLAAESYLLSPASLRFPPFVNAWQRHRP